MLKFHKIASPIVCIILLLNLSSCFAIDPDPYAGGKHKDLYALVNCTVPGAPGYDNVTIDIIETDSYGRTLFRFSSCSQFYHDAAKNSNANDFRNLRAYVICQKSNDNTVYYMENVCYLTTKSWSDISEEDLLSFKQDNMWDQEFDEDKCSIRKFIKSLRYSFPSEDELVDILGTPSDSTNFITSVVSVDRNGRTLAFVREISSASSYEYRYCKSYILISDENGEYSRECSIEIQDFYNHQEDLATLKQASGWVNP